MLDASNPSEAKAKKNKPNSQQRPVQRFWPESIANLQQKSEEGSEDGTDKLVGNSKFSNHIINKGPVTQPHCHRVTLSHMCLKLVRHV